jgi:riboflavin kinase/FMN adenylyltransferase
MLRLVRPNASIDPDLQRRVLAIGNFDGVHLGHRHLLEQLLRMAVQHHAQPLLVTLDPPPLHWLAPDRCPKPLTTLARRAQLAEEAGVGDTVALITSPDLLQMEAEAFFERVILEQFQAIGLVEGPNFHFGKDRRGTPELLGKWCKERGLELGIIERQGEAGQMISSSRIRQALSEGKIDSANQWLGYPYRLEGKVAAGARRGRQLGFPTANLSEVPVLIPAEGVYAGHATTAMGTYPSAIHIGPNPTFGEPDRKIEVHLLDFQGDLYGQPIAVDLVARLRGITRFEDAAALQKQLQQDIHLARELLRR